MANKTGSADQTTGSARTRTLPSTSKPSLQLLADTLAWLETLPEVIAVQAEEEAKAVQ